MRARRVAVLLEIGLMLAMTAGMASSQEPPEDVVIREIVDYAARVPDMQPTTYNESIRDAALSGDGRKVIANLLIKGERALYYGKKQDESALYLSNSDGTGLTRILDSGEDLPDERIGNRNPITRVAITDDGSKIAFGWLLEYERHEGGVVVSTINTDGTGLKEVARVRNFGVPGIGTLAISGDGSKIAFSTYPFEEGDTDYSDYEVFLVNADGTDLVQLTDNDVDDGKGNWCLDISDDGTRVVWVDWDSKIYVYDSVTGRMDLLAEGYYPSISGNGQTVVFDGEPNLGVIGFDGTGLQTLGDGFYYIYQTFISDNGNALAFREESELWFMRSDGTDKIQFDNGANMYGLSDAGTEVLYRRHAPTLYTATIPPPSGAEPTELAYDDGEPSGGYYYETEGIGSAVRMSPRFTPATVLGVRYYITNAEGSFIVRLLDDQDGVPGADLMTPLRVTPTSTGWFDVDLSSYAITVDGDFYVALMCGVPRTPSFGFDEEDNERAWDYDGTSWSPWMETYFFRAMVASGGAIPVAEPQYTVTIGVRRVTGGSKIVNDLISLRAGDPAEFSATITDEEGNGVDIPVTWKTLGEAGTITSKGQLTASQQAGDRGSIVAQTEDGSADTLSVNIIANLLSRMELTPESVVLSVGERVTFKAQGYDAHGNKITVRPFWHVAGDIGTISSITGTFVAKEAGAGYVVAFTRAVFGDAQTGVEGTAKVVVRLSLPASYALSQNVPNPFNPSTTLAYALPRGSMVRLMVYDLRGSLVRVLVDGWKEPGYDQVVWDGRDGRGQEVSSGVYIVRFEVGERLKEVTFSRSRRITLLR